MDAYTIDGDTIVIDRELTKLDMFVKDFLSVLKRHSDYLIVSGFVSIITGRSRGTEDVDILMPQMNEQKFAELLVDLKKNSFWCYQGENEKELCEYMERLSHLRFAQIDTMFPNMEMIPITPAKKTQWFEFTRPQKLRVGSLKQKIPPIEFEIVYKEKVLGSKKDKDDARHLRAVFANILKEEKFKEFENIILKYERND